MAPESSAQAAALAPLAVRIEPALWDVLRAELMSRNPNHKQWVENFKPYLEAGVANPSRKMPHNYWLNVSRHLEKLQSPARLLAFQGVSGLQIFPFASASWHGRAHFVQYGQTHAHTCVPRIYEVEGYRLGQYINHTRQSAAGKGTQRFDEAERSFFDQCLRGWAWKAVNGGAAEAFRQSLEQRPETPEHRWWYIWAKAYLYRYHNFAFSLMTADEVAEVLGEEVWQWLAPLMASPALEIASWPQETALVRGRAIAMLEPVAPAGCKPEWLPENSLGRQLLNNLALMQLAEYLNSRWHRT